VHDDLASTRANDAASEAESLLRNASIESSGIDWARLLEKPTVQPAGFADSLASGHP